MYEDYVIPKGTIVSPNLWQVDYISWYGLLLQLYATSQVPCDRTQSQISAEAVHSGAIP